MPNITKNLFLSTLQCPTYGWLQHHQPIEESTSPSDQLRIDQGLEIHERARNLYPDGVMVAGSNEACVKKIYGKSMALVISKYESMLIVSPVLGDSDM